jgi:hypothetical protein
MEKHQPPRLAVLLLRLCLTKRSYEAITGDLFEVYASGAHSAWWFWKQALSAAPWYLRPKPEHFDVARWRLHPFEGIAADIRYGIRTTLKTPALTGAILMATALGIGVNTGIFSLLNALVLRPLPVKDSGRVITIYQEYKNVKTRNIHGNSTLFSWSEYEQYRDSNQVLSGVAAYAPFEATFGNAKGFRTVQGQLVTCNSFSVLGRTPALGREFSADECKTRDASPYIVLSYAFWRAQFGMDRSILGRDTVINRHKFAVIGVAPEDCTGRMSSVCCARSAALVKNRIFTSTFTGVCPFY